MGGILPAPLGYFPNDSSELLATGQHDALLNYPIVS
jgi:hypothetical protein